MKVVVSDRADADLVQIYQRLSDQSPAAAESLVSEIARKFRNLGDFPFIGRDRSTFSSGTEASWRILM